MIFVSFTTYGLTSSAEQPTTWTNPYFYYHYNTPLALPTQKASANEMMSNQRVFTNYDDHSIQNTLNSHVVLLTTCLRDLKSKFKTKTKIVCHGNSDKLFYNLFSATKADLVHTHSEVETVKNELNKLKGDCLSFSLTNEE
jgi:hypothetical protein